MRISTVSSHKSGKRPLILSLNNLLNFSPGQMCLRNLSPHLARSIGHFLHISK